MECGIRTLVPNEISTNKDIILSGVKKVAGKKVVYDYAVIQPDGTALTQPPIVKQIVTGIRKSLHPEVYALTMLLIKEGHFDEPKNALELYLFYKTNLKVDFGLLIYRRVWRWVYGTTTAKSPYWLSKESTQDIFIS